MFRDTISQTPLSTPGANVFFTNITGGDYKDDVSFLTSLRAILPGRMGEGDSINLSFRASNYSSRQLAGLTVEDAFYHIGVMNWVDFRDQLTIHVFRNTAQENNTSWLDFINNNFANSFSGWHKVEKVTVFFRKAFAVYCFINPDRKSTALFVEDIDMRRLHFLQCGISAFLPWYFDVEQGFSDDEMELIQSLREKTPDRYEAIVEKIAAPYDFETLRIKRLLADFETKYERERCNDTRREIRNIVDQINSLNDRIGNYLREKRDAEIRLLGLEAKIAQGGESEIMDYFLLNKSLVLKDVDGTEITFVVKATLDYFDEENAKSCIKNDTSYFYNLDRGGEISHDDMNMLMNAIFIERLLKIQVCAAYRFDMNGRIRPISGYDYGMDGKNRMPNPHIDEYSCAGENVRIVNECLRDHEYIGALEQCIASCKNLNFADGTVMNEFVRRIQGKSSRSGRCILMPDGSVFTPVDAVKWLHQQQEPRVEEVA